MYSVRGVEEPLHQGDLIANFPVVLAPDSELEIVCCEDSPTYPKKAEIYKSTQVPGAFEGRLEQVVVSASKFPVMILSHSCDIDQRGFAVVSPVFPLSKETNGSRRQSIMSSKVNYRFPLKAFGDLIQEHSYVDFTIITTIRSALIPKASRLIGLSQYGRPLLVHHLYGYWCRPVQF